MYISGRYLRHQNHYRQSRGGETSGPLNLNGGSFFTYSRSFFNLPSWTIKIHAWPIFSRMNHCKKYMLATCRKLFEIIVHGSYMRIIPQHVSGHVRDTCMKFLGINKWKCYTLVTCRKCFRINSVSFSSTMVQLSFFAYSPLRCFLDCK